MTGNERENWKFLIVALFLSQNKKHGKHSNKLIIKVDDLKRTKCLKIMKKKIY